MQHFKIQLILTVPHFNMYKHEMTDILANDQKSHLSILKMAESAKRNKTIYQSLAEHLLDGNVEIETDWPDYCICIIGCYYSFHYNSSLNLS